MRRDLQPHVFAAFLCLSLCWLMALTAWSCATTAGKQASAIAEKCGAQVATDVVVEVSHGLDTSQAALEADALKYGVPLVLCIVGQLVTLPQPSVAETPSLVGPQLSERQRIAIAFAKAHR